MVWVSPFGNLRIKAYSRLPTAYRSVSRPSSPLCTKASTKCSSRRLIGPYMKVVTGQTTITTNKNNFINFYSTIRKLDNIFIMLPLYLGSFSPTISNRLTFSVNCNCFVKYMNFLQTVVGTGRFELPTSRLSVVRSNQLSYAPLAVANYN